MITEIEEFKQLIKDTYPETIDVQDGILFNVEIKNRKHHEHSND